MNANLEQIKQEILAGADALASSKDVYEFRKQLNIQQAELADMVGVRRETIGKLENGRYNPSLKLAMDIAKVFGKTVEEVFIFEEDEDEEDE